jgi:F-type H+-transporting ATPase subunit b
MQQTLIQFAATEATHGAEKKDLFAVLGINWKLLVLQTLAFLILVWLLKKFVYPPLLRSLDERQKTIEESVQAAKKAEEGAAKAQEDIEKRLNDARKEAGEILATAKAEAASQIEAAEAKAKIRAERMTAQAHEQLQQDIEAARKSLRKDTIELVALATEKVVQSKVNTATDQKIIETAIYSAEESKKK